MTRRTNILRNCEGAEIAEMAMVLPVMFMVFLSIFWMGRAYNISATVNHAAREGARVAVATSCATCGNYAGCGTTYACDTAVMNAIKASLQADHLDVGAIQLPSPALAPVFCTATNVPAACTNTTDNVTICRNVQLTPTGVNPQECGVVIGFRYQMLSKFPLFYANPTLRGRLENMNISAQAQMRLEQ